MMNRIHGLEIFKARCLRHGLQSLWRKSLSLLGQMSESWRDLSSACPLVIGTRHILGSQLLLAQHLHMSKGNNDPSLLLWESALASAEERST